MDTKVCSRCRKPKPLDSFRTKGGRRVARCSPCLSAESKAWRERNPDKARRNRLAWNEKNPDKVKEQQRRKTLWSRYGLTPEALDEMIERQGGVCAIEGCGGPAERVDHNHLTGVVRGILCHHCNIWLAPLEEDQAEWRFAAQRYLGEESKMKKYSTGEVIPEPDDAPVKDWSDEDSEELAKESEKGDQG